MGEQNQGIAPMAMAKSLQDVRKAIAGDRLERKSYRK